MTASEPSATAPDAPTDATADILPGLYEHYKGHPYEVLELARHSETEEWFVVYRALYGERGVWIRPLDMFAERVVVDGVEAPRFRRITDS
ncbi:DUF1653 domain-containing protein [Agromyces sp. Marseille-Q5079]|uniref:DUF1653 domain-containing protein n=1 Tax=Agromyces sp. Marseille-Q5079 TaxID=3439059 RepID=UPI003D9CBA79